MNVVKTDRYERGQAKTGVHTSRSELPTRTKTHCKAHSEAKEQLASIKYLTETNQVIDLNELPPLIHPLSIPHKE